MARVKRGTKRRARRKKYLKRTKGFFLTKSKLYQSAQEAANRADRYAFRDRRVKKREYRKLWIQRIGAAARLNGLTYGQLIHGLKAAAWRSTAKYLPISRCSMPALSPNWRSKRSPPRHRKRKRPSNRLGPGVLVPWWRTLMRYAIAWRNFNNEYGQFGKQDRAHSRRSRRHATGADFGAL